MTDLYGGLWSGAGVAACKTQPAISATSCWPASAASFRPCRACPRDDCTSLRGAGCSGPQGSGQCLPPPPLALLAGSRLRHQPLQHRPPYGALQPAWLPKQAVSAPQTQSVPALAGFPAPWGPIAHSLPAHLRVTLGLSRGAFRSRPPHTCL